MKKLFCIITTLLLFVCMPAACTDAPQNDAPPSGIQDDETPPTDNGDTTVNSEILVVYFSCTNTTKAVAEKIASASGATLYRIEPEEPYTSVDLNYNNDDSRANKEQNDPNARPAISGSVDNFSGYNTVFLGYPIWWGSLPKIIYTFLDAYDLSGKTVVPFCTSGGSGISASVNAIEQEEQCATVLEGRRFLGSVSQSDINEWVDGLDIKIGTEKENMQIFITIGTAKLSATLEENAATKALKERLKTAPITINMSDYGGWEKVGNFGFDLPTSNERITAQPCEFVLYQGNQLVIFYGSNSWSYTRLGKITGVTPDELKTVLGDGNVSVTLSL